MQTICKNIAFSPDGKCLLGNECICAKNKLWLEEESWKAVPGDQPGEMQYVKQAQSIEISGDEDVLKRRGLKAFDDSMRRTFEAIGAEGEQKSEWVEATIPPKKEGFYNVVTFENILIVTRYQHGRWEYDMEAGGSDAPDWVARYEPSTHQSLSAPQAQPIADKNFKKFSLLKDNEITTSDSVADKEVRQDGEPPKELKDYLEAKMRPYHNRISFIAGALECYHKMQEEIADVQNAAKVVIESHGRVITRIMKEADTQSIQIDGLLASNKECERQYKRYVLNLLEAHKQIAVYKKGLEEIVRTHGHYTPGPLGNHLYNIATEYLAKYSSPTPTDKP